MKLVKQIAILIFTAALFIAADIFVWNLCTKRCLTDNSPSRQVRSIELDKYLPFDENSEIVKLRDSLPLEGELPVIDGAEGLYPVYSAFVNAVYPESSVSFDGESFTSESKLQMRNTLKAYKAVVDGNADIAICAAPSKEQLEYAENVGAELEFVPIGHDAFVFIVNSENPVDSLTSEEIRGIYTGKYKSWSELGGKNIPISALQRLKGSGSQTAFLRFMNGETPVSDYDSFLGSSIGFSFRFYVEGMRESSGIKMLALDGVYPDKESISEGKYPLAADFYAVYDKRNENPNIPVLIEWFLSENGQRIIDETGYVPMA